VSRGRRFVVALLATLFLGVLALLYPWLERGPRWFDVRFEAPYFLLLLALVPFAWAFSVFGQDTRRPRLRMGTLAPFATGPRGIRAALSDVAGVVRPLALFVLVLALARPVLAAAERRFEDSGIDIVVAMDLSGSMRAVLDADPKDLPGKPELPPGKRLTRLDTAKIVLGDFVQRREGDRIGVVVFGRAAYVLSPPTLDYHLLTQMVSRMSLNVIDGSATAIGDGLGTAVARLRRSDARSKVIILLTDGDSNAGAISPEYAMELATQVGCKVFAIQIGTGDWVEVEDGFDLFGNPTYAQRRYPVNPELLQRIAKTTGGEAYVATDAKALASSMHEVLNQLEKTRFESISAPPDELFPLLLLPGAMLIALDALLRAWLFRRFP